MALAPTPTIPSNAPFSPRQRAWLNGLLAGIASAQQAGATPAGALAPQGANSGANGAAPADAAPAAPGPGSYRDVESDDPTQYAWHDSTISLEDRLQLAEGQPTELRLMAAMAQLDCGQCGYLCRTYAKAIQTGEESDLKKCVPGGRPTAKAVASIVQEAGVEEAGTQPSGPSPGGAVDSGVNGRHVAAADAEVSLADDAPAEHFGRDHPFPAVTVQVRRLTEPESAKDVRLVSLSLAGSGLSYRTGDAVGVCPKNGRNQVEALIKRLDCDGSEPVRTPDGASTCLREALTRSCDVESPSDEAFELMVERTADAEQKARLRRCADGEEIKGLMRSPRLIDLIARFPDLRLPPDELVRRLDPLRPRLYSIASSPLVDPKQVDLVVGVVRYSVTGYQRLGVASNYLANQMQSHDTVPIFIQRCDHFRLPENPATPVVMVGPGTGVAPFRAFLQERVALGATGENWLFFGNPHEATDFLLRDELLELQHAGTLTRLTTAFSRDHAPRVYVQDRMRENADELWRWLDRGAHFYVCGDAARMAGDVDRALNELAQDAGGMTAEAAADYVRMMRKTGRYQRDVY